MRKMWSFLLAALALTGCAAAPADALPAAETAETAEMTTTETEETAAQPVGFTVGNLSEVPNTCGGYWGWNTGDAYYEIARLDDENDQESMHALLLKTDYATARQTVLCNVPGCTHDLRAAGESEEAIAEKFLGHFACTPEKFKLALGIADLQRPVLDAADPMDCSIYAGIPFCPSRCSYCSFVSRTVGDKATRALVQPYVDKLCRELTAIRETADRCGLRIRTFYIGGGTPTALSAAQLEQLMSHIARTFDLAALDEYTVEAGRPDCTDAEKLCIIKQYGATRISINPQTFSDEVLRNIGRRHTAQDIIDCFAAARAAGHTNINMDLIAGLPGDTVEGFTASLRQAIALDPENITVHTLTLKRASNLVVEHRAAAYDDVSAMLESCRELADAGYRPYYMYRQKGTLQNLENIGWAKPGCECLYNIYIMEEIHTILSAGAGGSTKLVIPGQRRGKIERIFNFKYPTEYIDRFEEILARKQGVEDFYARYTTT